jgi:DNA-binding NtrC family response regulator
LGRTQGVEEVAKILSFGIAKEHLDRRAKLLAQNGFNVSSVTQKDEALRLAKMLVPNIVIFGHKVPPALRSSLSRHMKKVNPDVQMIYMYEGSTQGTEMADAILNVESEPEVLVEAIHYLEDRRKTDGVSA